ncbi:MAG: hypothetical protein C0615_01905 [Desulfuromonas sp.]|nr:MAG: hypothetical protein C0615_01905 [Desulfuromonas sp.]
MVLTKTVCRISCLLIILLVSGCSGITVSQDYSSARELAGLRFYAWSSEQQPRTGDARVDTPLLDSRIRSAIDNTLAARGYRQADSDHADFLVSYQYSLHQRVRGTSDHASIGFAGRHSFFGFGTGTTISDYNEGLLLIDFLDRTGRTTLWRGKGSRPIATHTEPEKLTHQINEMVHKIIDQFPP